jgi:hypothetical protein
MPVIPNDGESAGYEPAIVNAAAKHGSHRHDEYGAEPARTDGDTRGAGGVVHQRLIEERKNGHQAVDHAAQQSDQQTSEGEIAVLENRQVHDWVANHQLPEEKRHKRHDQNYRGPTNPCGAEPIIFLALVQDDLQSVQPNGKQTQSDGVHAPGLGGTDVGGSSMNREIIRTATIPTGTLM